jgi:hypothetical protein
MAGIVAHIVFAKQALDSFLPRYDAGPFLVGTVFPDIRQMAGIERSLTHPARMSLDEVEGTEDPFLAGMKFHALLDLRRERLVEKLGVYEGLPEGYPRTVALKLCEDQMLQSRIKDWSPILDAFEGTYPAADAFVPDREITARWNQGIRRFVSVPLTHETMKRFVGRMHPEYIDEIMALVRRFEAEGRAERYVDRLESELEAVLSK